MFGLNILWGSGRVWWARFLHINREESREKLRGDHHALNPCAHCATTKQHGGTNNWVIPYEFILGDLELILFCLSYHRSLQGCPLPPPLVYPLNHIAFDKVLFGLPAPQNVQVSIHFCFQALLNAKYNPPLLQKIAQWKDSIPYYASIKNWEFHLGGRRKKRKIRNTSNKELNFCACATDLITKENEILECEGKLRTLQIRNYIA